MSRRNSREEKGKRRAITKGTTQGWIDLIDYIKLRTRCTTGEAIRVLMAGAIKVDSHPVGYVTRKDGKRLLQPYIKSEHRNSIIVTMPESVR